MVDKMAFGAEVRRARESLGWTQLTLADAAGFEASYVCQVERGKRLPSLANFARLVCALGPATSADKLLGID